MNKARRILAIALAIVLCVAALSGCAGKGSTPTNTNAPANTSAPAATNAPSQTEVPKAEVVYNMTVNFEEAWYIFFC